MACDGAGTLIAWTTLTELNGMRINRIEGGVKERASIQKNDLSLPGATYCPGGKEVYQPFVIEVYYEGAHAKAIDEAITNKSVDTLTITQPDGFTKAGTAFITSMTDPSSVDNEPQMLSYAVQWDGGEAGGAKPVWAAPGP